ncbi:hypothetical protein BKA70DRAFT_1222233 [Coprinopsis sp. MPI-PUGE-AT-0042]|nr:hypothetical protein BKA70DRAFT_1222233 [Coprinopsis sp. MPI-PUGE-AT-0042]
MLLTSLLHSFPDLVAGHHVGQGGCVSASTASPTGPSSPPILPHPPSWCTGTPNQARPLPSLNMRVEMVEETVQISRKKVIINEPTARVASEEYLAPTQESSESTTVFVDLATLGLDSVLPPDSKDYTVAALKLGQATRGCDSLLQEIDGMVAALRRLVAQYNDSNDDVALASSLYEAVKGRYPTGTNVGTFMKAVVDTLVPQGLVA